MGISRFALLEDTQLDLVFTEPDHLRFAAEQLGDAATPQDGTAAQLEEAATQLAVGGEAVAQLDGLLAEHFAPAIEAHTDVLVEDTEALDRNIEVGRRLLDEVEPATPAAGGPGGTGDPETRRERQRLERVARETLEAERPTEF